MSAVVFNKFDNHIMYEKNAKEVEMKSLNYLEVIEGQHPDLLSNHKVIDDDPSIKHRRNGYVINLVTSILSHSLERRIRFEVFHLACGN